MYAFLTEDVLVISRRQNKEKFFLIQSLEWLDVSFEEEVVTTAQHDSKRTVDIVLHIIAHDIIKFTTRPNETIKLENPYNIR